MGSAEPTLWVPQEKALWLYQGVADKGPQCECHLFRQHDRSEQGVGSTPHLAVWKGHSSLAIPLVNAFSLFFHNLLPQSLGVQGKRSSGCVGSANMDAWARCYPGMAWLPTVSAGL